MGIMSRSTSMTRYRVIGELEAFAVGNYGFWAAVAAGVNKGAYRKAQTPGELVGQGFVSQSDFTEVKDPGIHAVHGTYVVLGFRTDRARISSRILEMELRDQTKAKLEMTGKQRLSSAQRRVLKQNIREMLFRNPFPAMSIQVHDLVWNTTEGVLYFTSVSQKAREELERWFKHCFGLRLVPLIPYLRAGESNGKTIAKSLENRDFVTVLQEEARVGRDFLKWLWYKADVGGGIVPCQGDNALLVMLMDRMTLVGADTGTDRVSLRGESSERREAVAALRENKQIEDLRLCIRSGGDDYEMTLNAQWLTMSGLRVPTVLPDPEKTAEDDESGILLEKIALVETAWGLLDGLLAAFMQIRTSDEWGTTELPAMRKWIEEAA